MEFQRWNPVLLHVWLNSDVGTRHCGVLGALQCMGYEAYLAWIAQKWYDTARAYVKARVPSME